MKHSKLCDNFRIHDFSLLGTTPVTWKDQLLNDLKQFWESEGLELIGAVHCSHSSKQVFKLMFYKQPKYTRKAKHGKKCPFFIEPYYEELGHK